MDWAKMKLTYFKQCKIKKDKWKADTGDPQQVTEFLPPMQGKEWKGRIFLIPIPHMHTCTLSHLQSDTLHEK